MGGPTLAPTILRVGLWAIQWALNSVALKLYGPVTVDAEAQKGDSSIRKEGYPVLSPANIRIFPAE